ncbi:lactonase family protein [Nocardiopsis sediminis]|uniref:Lactonase family protein n=1 Tax=Nocardiopsis sediminis TaxID=1778267 RepID=A0ABV8FGQ0_9ACTN
MAERRLWIGTYTRGSVPAGSGAGVHRVLLDTRTGELSGGAPAIAVEGASFLAAHPRSGLVYAVSEVDEGRVTALSVGPDGVPAAVGSAPTGGGSPCHVAVHPAGGHIVTANYADGAVGVHRLDAAGAPGAPQVLTHSGSGPRADRQEGPHAHSTAVAPGGAHLLIADLGTDELRGHAFDPGAADPAGPGFTAARLAPGTGPRHVAVHPSGHVYVAGELDARVHVLRWDRPTATAAAVAGVPAGAEDGDFPSEIALSADGERLYVANRGSDTIAVFAVTDGGAALRPLGHVPAGGAWPRHFALVGDFIVVAAQHEGVLAVLRTDPEGGLPTDTGHRLPVPDPACVLPAG